MPNESMKAQKERPEMKEIGRLGHGYINRVAWSPDGKLLALAGSLGVWVYATHDLNTLGRQLDDQCVTALAFSPDSRLLGCGKNDGTIQLWNTETWGATHSLTGHTCSISEMVFSEDGTVLAANAYDEFVLVWAIRTGDLLLQNTNPITEVKYGPFTDTIMRIKFALSPDGTLLACAVQGKKDKQYEVWVWDVRAGTLKTTVSHPKEVYSLLFSPDGRLLATGQNKAIGLWDIATNRLRTTITPAGSRYCFSPDNRLLAFNGDGGVNLWDIQADRPKSVLAGHTRFVDLLTFGATAQIA